MRAHTTWMFGGLGKVMGLMGLVAASYAGFKGMLTLTACSPLVRTLGTPL